MRLRPVLSLFSLSAALAGCAAFEGHGADAVLLGEQHDAPLHRELQQEWITRLARQGKLAAVALEMAEQGVSTRGLPPGADEAQVRAALRWDNAGWPWETYAPVVMSAVRAGVPVLGANLPRDRMRPAMQDAALDARLPPPALAAQREAMREGHCGLLPESQLAPMARIQIARDRAMAETVAAAAERGRTVLLVAGGRHVDPALGVPLHLPSTLRAHAIRLPEQPPAKDYCEDLRRQKAPQRPAS